MVGRWCFFDGATTRRWDPSPPRARAHAAPRRRGGGWLVSRGSAQLQGHRRTWLDADGHIAVRGGGGGSLDRYVQAFEFAMCAMVMDFAASAPTNLFEKAVAIVLCIIMGCVYGYMIGTVCSVVSTMDPATSEYNMTMDLLNQYLAEIRLDESLSEQVREYFVYCKRHFHNQYHGKLLQLMSPALRGMVTRHQHSVWIRQVWFFNCNDDEERSRFVTDVGLALVLEAFAPREVLIREGDAAEAMYIVQRGLVGVHGRPLGIGRFFGEDMILEGTLHTYSARVMTYLDVYTLRRASLERIFEHSHFPRTTKLIALRVLFMKFQASDARVVSTFDARAVSSFYTPTQRGWRRVSSGQPVKKERRKKNMCHPSPSRRPRFARSCARCAQ